ncbi:RNA methyltransferase [Eubacterium sp. AB3007]|uniref:TrmH family RNA methyltransferase n=1 Tax=Eubacterium sp. AB3007 TaxID=1392487 RepID=UPI0004808EDE|nr:RNA methyltransferase [Eubacterium sp. AB3007]MBQ1471153.1 RNA methyltransferase [Eubacterium sp.]
MDYHISSPENRIYKDCVRLARRKYREREGRYLIEGRNIVQEAIASQAEVETVLLREDVSPEQEYACRVCTMDGKLFDRISQTETSQGVIAIVRKNRDAEDGFQKAIPDGGNLLVLDKVQDPGNIGTMIRTAEGAGYAGVLCVKGTGDPYSPKAARAAAGSLFRMRICTGVEEHALAAMLCAMGKRMVVTAMEGEDYREASLHRDIALIIGNEGNGVSREIMEQADLRVRIPMAGKLESLNASVAAGILMYEAAR